MLSVVIPQEHYSEDTMLAHCSTDCGQSVPNNEAAFIESIVFNFKDFLYIIRLEEL